jgi:hypothetical protein
MIRVDYQLAGSSTVKSFDLWAYNCWKVDGLTYQEPTTWTNHWVGDCEGKMDTTGSTFCADLEGTTNVDVKGYVRTVYEEYGYINANIYPDSCAGSTMINDATCINNEIKFLILGCKHNSKYYDGKGKGESCVVDQGICQ